MEQADTLQLIAEIAAVFAGFSGLSSAYVGSGSRNVRLGLRIGQRYNLMIAVFVLFSALAPLVLASFGIEGRLLWKLSSLVLMGTSLGGTLDYLRVIRGLPEDVRSRLRRPARDTPVLSLGVQLLLTMAIFFGNADWPFEAIYISNLTLGLVAVAAIFAANAMPRRFDYETPDANQQEQLKE